MAGLEILGKYEILDLLGVGGMGTVYRARDTVLERIVAVKLLHRDQQRVPGSEQGWTRFLNEARAVARLNHPTIVSVYDFSDEEFAGAFFAMEYVDGCTIEDYVRMGTDARLAPALHLMQQLLGGLAYAHDQGVVHRDIKPSNLLVTHDRRLKITDFGIAKIGTIKHTQTGMMLGTPAYMAPERYLGGAIDRRCDVYSAGVVFYELLTGRRPFSGALTEVMYQICHVVPRAVSAVEPAIPAVFDPVLAKALAKNPDARFQTAVEFAAAMNAAIEALGLVTRQEGRGLAGAGTVGPVQDAIATEAVSDAVPRRDGAPVGWSSAQLADIEQRLSLILGPMARIVVKRAAAHTQDPEQLCEELAAQLRTDEERRRFLGSVGAAARKETGLMFGTGPPPVPQGAADGGGIAAAPLDRTAKVLMRYMGPIGAVLVRKTAPAALNEADLYERLAQRISDARERARFIAEITRP